MSRVCKSCRFFREGKALEVGASGQGTCHIKPPSVFLIPMQGPMGQGLGVQCVRPMVAPDDFCGDWQSAGEKSVTPIR